MLTDVDLHTKVKLYCYLKEIEIDFKVQSTNLLRDRVIVKERSVVKLGF